MTTPSSSCHGSLAPAQLHSLSLPTLCAFALALLLGLSGCATAPPLPPANLGASGWKIREGQAVWRRSKHAPELAGDVLVATGPDGQAFVQFSKGSLPFLVAQSTPEQWQVELPTQNQRYSGRGHPPSRLIFLYLPPALSGERLPGQWSWQTDAGGNWRLENRATGQSLTGYFTQ